MSDAAALTQGVIVGFSVAAPVGPIGLLVIRRTLARGPLHGLATGLGAAAADTVYGVVAALGLTVVTSVLLGHQGELRLAGGIALLILGLRSLRARPSAPTLPEGSPAPSVRADLAASFAGTFALTLANPLTILSFFAMLAGLGASGARGGALVVGVFAGSALWWLALSAGVSAVGRMAGPRVLRGLDLASGAALCGFGILTLLSAGG